MPPSSSAALILVRQSGFPSCSTPSSMLAVSWQCKKAKIWTSKMNLMVSCLGVMMLQEIATSATAALPHSSRLMFAEWPRQCLDPDIKGGRPLWKGLGCTLDGDYKLQTGRNPSNSISILRKIFILANPPALRAKCLKNHNHKWKF